MARGLRPLLRFCSNDGKTTDMALLCLLLYPSVCLAELGDPLEIRRVWCQKKPNVDCGWAQNRSSGDSPELEKLSNLQTQAGPPDESWYWAAPLLLDLARHPDEARK